MRAVIEAVGVEFSLRKAAARVRSRKPKLTKRGYSACCQSSFSSASASAAGGFMFSRRAPLWIWLNLSRQIQFHRYILRALLIAFTVAARKRRKFIGADGA